MTNQIHNPNPNHPHRKVIHNITNPQEQANSVNSQPKASNPPPEKGEPEKWYAEYKFAKPIGGKKVVKLKGLSNGLMRLSYSIEDPEDLIPAFLADFSDIGFSKDQISNEITTIDRGGIDNYILDILPDEDNYGGFWDKNALTLNLVESIDMGDETIKTLQFRAILVREMRAVKGDNLWQLLRSILNACATGGETPSGALLGLMNPHDINYIVKVVWPYLTGKSQSWKLL